MDENDDKIKSIIKLKSIISIYDNLQIKLDGIIETLKNKMHNYFANSYFERILFTEKFEIHTSNLSLDISQNLDNGIVDIPDYTELLAVFLLFAQLNDTKLILNKTESTNQLWMNLSRDTDNRSNIENILNIGTISILFP
ncbi:unnamed protein product [Rotaria sp. Silwood2]|nr:unnamed protein product [Rotaria sp. Silwood2]CAF3254638.1 unnamed protein product [Rotaria sp. Silwood2]CAF3349845.1 unnamed protein product [Rotaria sp. Silwood2]CAF4165210.1 unnamed protein product [Rotaria sp. Silwood2]CAF4179122.1 unnamed protein product [Rotaria sp. Silwood2]